MTTLTSKDRATFKRALLAAGVKTRNMDDIQLTNAHAALALDVPAPVEPEVEEVVGLENHVKNPAPKPATTPAADTGKLAGSIEQIIIDAMKGNATLDEDRVIDLIKQHANIETITHHNITVEHPADIPAVTIEGAHYIMPDLIKYLTINMNVFLVGEAGGGKTTIAQQLAKALDMDFHYMSALTDKFEYTGFEDAKGKYHRTPLREAVEHGGLFLLDEVDCSNAAAVKSLNGILENGIAVFPDGATFEVDKNKTKFMFAANTVGTGPNRRYVGGYELDRSTLDRFLQVNIDYDPAIERSMAKSAFIGAGGKESDLSAAYGWLSTVGAFRQLLHDRNILALCTPRATMQGAALLAIGKSERDVKTMVLHKHLSKDQLKQLGE